jgi:hypothetical protein
LRPALPMNEGPSTEARTHGLQASGCRVARIGINNLPIFRQQLIENLVQGRPR